MVTQAEINNNHKESKPIESEDESDSKSFESESNDFDIDSDLNIIRSITPHNPGNLILVNTVGAA